MKRYGKVMLADSHQITLGGIQTLLEKKFERTFMVADEESLLEAAEKIKPDLIIADLSFPVSKEKNIVRLLKKRFPEIQLIILSVYDEMVALQECFEAGAEGFVLKRTAVDDLILAIEAVHQGKSFVSPSAKGSSRSRHKGEFQ